MSYEGRHAAGKSDQSVPTGDRRTFLAVLDEVVRSRPGLACGIVTRQGVPVLHVINAEMPRYGTEVGADFADGDWWYTWAVSGDRIGPVGDAEGARNALVRALKANGWTR
ncbi:hypothetical protein SAMN04489712_110174 [Thermomonospora echinospora]|uniref:Uncharacterized protein n=1 Tax=Thermomonospora echinospora TaxID=1992 RepID=A0A1H6CM00_9ACTN|nr:hypothetical protein [Thermomonospora echinospora]SEG73958.1 hypothetical protein SAMN04489712_110174 [Thermomonospora echinospora]